MANKQFVTPARPVSFNAFNGGLNTASGPLNVQDTESTDLQNIDFNKFGSILKRNGYTTLNSSALFSSPECNGLHWFEYNSAGTTVRKAINVSGQNAYKMDDLDRTWDNITGGVTISSNNLCDFESFLDTCLITNNQNPPFYWDPSSANCATMTVPTGLTKAKFVTQYSNYTMLANVEVSGTRFNSRFYWSTIKTIDTWSATDFIEVGKGDGQEITGFKVLGDKLVIYKTRSIYIATFTGDRDIPFVLPNGGKTASDVGCVAPFSIQEVKNVHVFMSYDGFYLFDGFTSRKISDKINDTIDGLNKTQFVNVTSMYQKDKNRYWSSVTDSGKNTKNKVITWDSFNNAFSIYSGISANVMSIFLVNGYEERPYFADYGGFTYRGDFGTSDRPSDNITAISAYFYTNWKHYGDIVDKKGIPNVYIYYKYKSGTLSFAYSFDFADGDDYTLSFDTSGGGSVFGTGVFGTATFGGSGGNVKRQDLTGRGRVVRFKFANNTIGEEFQIDGLGNDVNLQTYV